MWLISSRGVGRGGVRCVVGLRGNTNLVKIAHAGECTSIPIATLIALRTAVVVLGAWSWLSRGHPVGVVEHWVFRVMQTVVDILIKRRIHSDQGRYRVVRATGSLSRA